MMFLADSPESPQTIAAEMGVECGQLITPLTKRTNVGRVPWALDNGAFSHFDTKQFQRILKRELPNKSRCLFVAAPDVVGDARRTLECFEHWLGALHGWPVALVIQDGAEHLGIPWRLLRAVFIGGSTEFKCGPKAVAVIKAAQIMGKHVHVGRINTRDRWDYFDKLGVDTCDGTGLARYSHMRKAINAPNLLDAV
jgi:hypothetical protein